MFRVQSLGVEVGAVMVRKRFLGAPVYGYSSVRVIRSQGKRLGFHGSLGVRKLRFRVRVRLRVRVFRCSKGL